MTNELIKHMANRFLCWKLPKPWHPDGGVSFNPLPVINPGTPYENDRWPVGTNLFDAQQAEVMVQHMIAGAPPVPMLLFCPLCSLQHVDEPDEAAGWTNPPHRSHLCHGCGAVWRPADVATTGVRSIETRGSADSWSPRDGVGLSAQLAHIGRSLSVQVANTVADQQRRRERRL